MRAAIDIGSNTVLLLIAKVEGNHVEVIHEEQRIPRLGRGVDENKTLHEDSIQRVLDVLAEYKSIIEEDYFIFKDVIVTATSAVRDAKNRDYFLNRVFDEVGFDVRLLTGEEEAQWTFVGALSVMDVDEDQTFYVVDIGGGSTEVAMGRKGQLLDYHSFDMGCVRFKERFLQQNPPFQDEIKQCIEEIKKLLSKRRFKAPKNIQAIGVAGTATSLAAIDLELDVFENEKLNGHVIKEEKLSKGIEIFSLHTYDQLLELSPNLLKGREDIFLAGLLILDGFMKFKGVDEIKVSTGGIRHGALLMTKKDEN